VPVATRPIAVADLAREIRNVGNGVTLHGGQFDVDVTGAPATVVADAALLSAAVHGLVWALLALGETAHDPTVRVTLSGGAAASLRVTQPTAVLNEPMLLRFFEAGTKGRPGGPSTELAVQLARYTAARHGAEIEVSSGPTTGTTVTMSLR
jgi:hypothetical protein